MVVSFSSTVGESNAAYRAYKVPHRTRGRWVVPPLGIEPSVSACKTDAFTELAQGALSAW